MRTGDERRATKKRANDRAVAAGRYRARFEIISRICDLLESSDKETTTSVMYKTSLSFGQKNDYLKMMEQHGLITWQGKGKGARLQITKRGRKWNVLQKRAMAYFREGKKQQDD